MHLDELVSLIQDLLFNRVNYPPIHFKHLSDWIEAERNTLYRRMDSR